jgi:predicted nucleic acid-binding protein
MPFVLDASVTVCWAFADESDPAVSHARTLLKVDSATSPNLWWFEVRNVLIVNERRGRITEPETLVFLRQLAQMPIVIDMLPNESDLLMLARRHRITIYDSAYLELARRQGSPLATLDSKLKAAARAESVALIGTP